MGQRREAAVARKTLASGLVSSVPQVAILSNGGYSVMITDAGAGYGTWRNLDVSRWREDATRDCWGQFCYVRDLDGNKQWSVGSQPLRHPGGTTYEHTFSRDKAEFHCVAEDIEIRWSVCVAPGVDAEVRSLTVSNIGRGTRRLEFTSYLEVCLNHRRADRAHPAFAKLFIETEFDEATGALIARRRPREAEEKPLYAVHVSACSQGEPQSVTYETDRLRFLGRGRTTENPVSLEIDAALSNTVGAVLDPIFALRRTLVLTPGATASLAFATGASDSRAAVQNIADRFSKIRGGEDGLF